MYRFLLHVSYSYGLPICRPLEKEIRRRGYEVKWFSELDETSKFFSADDQVLTKPLDVINYQPHVVLSATNIVPDFFPGIKVQIFHGFSINKRSEEKGHFRIRGFFDLYCTQGPSTTLPFSQLAEELGYFEAVETGWSKVDPLFPLTSAKSPRPTVIISSTFTPRLSLAHNEEFIAEVQRLTELKTFDWLITAHPLMDDSVVNKLKALESDNVAFKNTTDLIPLFKQADIMIADTTSAIAEFLLQRKPVVTFKNNKPGGHLINIESPKELEGALQKALSPPTELLKNIDAFIENTHPYTDGNSSSRVIDACVAFLQKDKKHLKRKPLNLIRKLQIRKKYHFFTLRSYNKPITVK